MRDLREYSTDKITGTQEWGIPDRFKLSLEVLSIMEGRAMSQNPMIRTLEENDGAMDDWIWDVWGRKGNLFS